MTYADHNKWMCYHHYAACTKATLNNLLQLDQDEHQLF